MQTKTTELRRSKAALTEMTPVFLRENAFQTTDTEKIRTISFHFEKIMETLGLDLSNDSLKDTPGRVAKMFIREVFSGLDPANFPSISLFDNTYGYEEMLIEKDITVYSWCEHHFVPIIGKAHVAYFPKDKVIGLSKINRVVQYYARRPQVQERLTNEIAEGLKALLGTDDVAVSIEAVHLCVAMRGVNDTNSATVTRYFGGKFKEEKNKSSFLHETRQPPLRPY